MSVISHPNPALVGLLWGASDFETLSSLPGSGCSEPVSSPHLPPFPKGRVLVPDVALPNCCLKDYLSPSHFRVLDLKKPALPILTEVQGSPQGNSPWVWLAQSRGARLPPRLGGQVQMDLSPTLSSH